MVTIVVVCQYWIKEFCTQDKETTKKPKDFIGWAKEVMKKTIYIASELFALREMKFEIYLIYPFVSQCRVYSTFDQKLILK